MLTKRLIIITVNVIGRLALFEEKEIELASCG